MRIIFGVLIVGILVSVFVVGDHPSLAMLSAVDSNTLASVIDDAINCCGSAFERFGAWYQDVMASSRIVYWLQCCLPADQKPGTIVLLGCGFVGLWGFGRTRKKK